MSNNGWVPTTIDDKYTRRWKNKQLQIEIAQENQKIAAENRKKANRASLEASARSAEASVGVASRRAQEAATNSSRLLTEFMVESKFKRSAAIRQGDKALGNVEAAFGAAGIESIGASQDTQRDSTLNRLIQEVGFNIREEQLSQQARSAITGAAGTLAQATASVQSDKERVRVSERQQQAELNTYNPYQKSQVWTKGKYFPVFTKGF